MCHIFLHDPKLYTLLLQADEERAASVRAAGCSCGGVLHSVSYPRKARGLPVELRQFDHQRRSFCCNRNGCRSRYTPRSVFYLGRRVFVGAVMLLGTAMRCTVSGRALRELCQLLGVPRVTLDRWRAWWSWQHRSGRLRLLALCRRFRKLCPAHCWRASRPRTPWPNYRGPCASWHR